MKALSRFLFACLVATVAHAEPKLSGRWDGAIVIGGQELTIGVDFRADGDALTATIDIPQQGAKGVVLKNVTRTADKVNFELPAGQGVARFAGVVADSSLTGDFTQAGIKGAFHLERSTLAPATAVQAQASLPKLREEQLEVSNGKIRLAGALALPPGEGPFPVVVLLSGSGPQDRDEEIAGFRPFRLIAERLTADGVAVLRYDDRGMGGSTGDTLDATLADYADDAEAWIAQLHKDSRLDRRRIELLGHSDGAAVAAKVAARRSDIAAVVLLAGPALRGEQILVEQLKSLLEVSGLPVDQATTQLAQQRQLIAAVRKGNGLDLLEKAARDLARTRIAQLPETQRSAIADVDAYLDAAMAGQMRLARSAYFRYFIDHDPGADLARLRMPVLAIFGDRDLQVSATSNRTALEKSLPGNQAHVIKTYADANHLFQTAKTGSPAEYATLDKMFVAGLLDDISAFIRAAPAHVGSSQ